MKFVSGILVGIVLGLTISALAATVGGWATGPGTPPEQVTCLTWSSTRLKTTLRSLPYISPSKLDVSMRGAAVVSASSPTRRDALVRKSRPGRIHSARPGV